MSTTFIWILLFIQLFLFIAGLLLVIFMIYTIYALHTGAPFLPTNKNNVENMIELMSLEKGDKIIDLGSGDGRILFKASKEVENIKGMGFEINPVVYWWSKIRNKLKSNTNIKIYRKNLWDIDLSEADVVSIFFVETKMGKLKKKIKKEMQPGSKVVSHAFKFPDWEIEKQKGNNYLYTV